MLRVHVLDPQRECLRLAKLFRNRLLADLIRRLSSATVKLLEKVVERPETGKWAAPTNEQARVVCY